MLLWIQEKQFLHFSITYSFIWERSKRGMDQNLATIYGRILKTELIAATGCTEPIAIAYAAAKAREVLGTMPQHCHVYCSGNIVKNVMGVTVPNSGGLKGIDVAAVLGILGGDPGRNLEVLESVTEEHRIQAKKLLQEDFCSCSLVKGVENLYIRIHLTTETDVVLVEIQNYHKNITRIEKNGEVLFAQDTGCREVVIEENPDKDLLNVREILSYADQLCDKEIFDLLSYQVECNLAIADQGLKKNYGAQVGKILLATVKEANSDTARTIAKAYAAAGSDARMNGCAMPVVINSGSGNQGLTVSLPVHVYAELYKIGNDRKLRALAVSNLIAIHQKKYIGSLSAYCGAVSAACGAGAAIAYLLGEGLTEEERYAQISATITNTIATVGGMVCDGAKSSCAAKIATAIDCAVTAYELGKQGQTFQPGEGLVMDSVEETIESVGRMGRKGMHSTDLEILQIMLREESE